MFAMLGILIMVVILFGTGFAAIGFLWRWWLLLPVAGAGAIFAILKLNTAMGSEGIEAAFMGVGIVILIFGAVSGFIASTFMITGRSQGSNPRAAVVLPSTFGLGLLSYLALVVLW